MMSIRVIRYWLLVIGLVGCAVSEIKPVDIYPEDNCSQCRMAVSDKSFASEIITEEGEVLKFDDLGCMEKYRKQNSATKIKAIFVSDYETKKWMPYEKSVIIQTGIATPMGSGKVALSDAAKAEEVAGKFPFTKGTSSGESCGGGCCAGAGE